MWGSGWGVPTLLCVCDAFVVPGPLSLVMNTECPASALQGTGGLRPAGARCCPAWPCFLVPGEQEVLSRPQGLGGTVLIPSPPARLRGNLPGHGTVLRWRRCGLQHLLEGAQCAGPRGPTGLSRRSPTCFLIKPVTEGEMGYRQRLTVIMCGH